MKIAMIGAGYVGLVSGACLSEFGHHVVYYDQDHDKIQRLRRNEIPIYEPGLEPIVVDLRNIYRPEEMRTAGFQYSSIGRP